MLNNFQVLIIGGDARYLEVIETMADKGANIFLIGFDQLSFEDKNIQHSDISTINYSVLDAIILPVAGTDQTGKIQTTYSNNEDVSLSAEMIRKTPKDCTIYTGTSNTFLENISQVEDRKLIALFLRDDIAILNSIPTAEGALQIAMEETDRTIHGSEVLVLGFGRVGITVARLFSAVGAKVSVCVRKSADMARIREMGLSPTHIKDLKQVISYTDICINTIPNQIINKEVILAMDTSTLIIDLASQPGGTDFNFAQTKQIKAIHALALPGNVAPTSAGVIIAEVLLDLISESSNN